MLLSTRTAQILSLAVLSMVSAQAFSCPFCFSNPMEKPLHLELKGQQIAALVRPIGDVPEYAEMLRARKFGSKVLDFETDTLFRGAGKLRPGGQFKAKALGFFRKDTTYLMTSIHPELNRPKFRAVSSSEATFLARFAELPMESEANDRLRIERLAFFLPYLDSADDAVAEAARWELARAPYDEVRKLKTKLDASTIERRISAPKATKPSFGLQFLFLGLIGSTEHLPFYEKWLRSPTGLSRGDLEGLVSGYLMIAGTAGVPRVLEIIAKREAKSAKDLSISLIKALRFLAANETILNETQIIGAYRATLANPYIAYWGMSSLTRLADWDSLPLVWAVYQDLTGPRSNLSLTEKTMLLSKVKTYLGACPSPLAKEYLASVPARISRTTPPESSVSREQRQFTTQSAASEAN